MVTRSLSASGITNWIWAPYPAMSRLYRCRRSSFTVGMRLIRAVAVFVRPDRHRRGHHQPGRFRRTEVSGSALSPCGKENTNATSATWSSRKSLAFQVRVRSAIADYFTIYAGVQARTRLPPVRVSIKVTRY